MDTSIVAAIVNMLEPNIGNAIALLALEGSMTDDEQRLVRDYVGMVLTSTSISELKEKEVIAYMKLHLKTRQDPVVKLEELLDAEQRARLEQLTDQGA